MKEHTLDVYIILKSILYVMIRCSISGKSNGLEFMDFERSVKSSTKQKKTNKSGLKSVSGQFLRRNDEMLNPKKPTFVKGRN